MEVSVGSGEVSVPAPRRIRACAVGSAFVVGLITFAMSSPVFAQQSPLDQGPSSAGLPGADFVRSLVGWGKWLGLGACGLVMIYGAATWAGFGSASAGRAVQGKTYVLSGVIGAAVIGLVAVVVPMMYTAAGG